MGYCGQNGSQTGNKIREFTEMIVGRMHGEAEMRMKMYKTEQKQKVQKNGGIQGKSGTGENGSSQNEKTTLAGLLAAGTFNTGNSGIILEKLNDYDYLMKKFYNVHPTTTAGRDLMRAENFLAADLPSKKTPTSPRS